MNIGIAAAKGEYIGIVGTDDYIALNMYEELYLLAKEYAVDMIKADFSAIQGSGWHKAILPGSHHESCRPLSARHQSCGRIPNL
jgi:hypothetical protein